MCVCGALWCLMVHVIYCCVWRCMSYHNIKYLHTLLVFLSKDLYLIITQKLTFMKSGRFHEIWQISPWNLVDFTLKSGGFHPEIWWISPWNLVDFMKSMKSGRFQVKSGRFQVKSGRFHEICEIQWISGEIHPKPYKIRRVFAETSDFIRFGVDFTWNPPDFMKSARFHLKSTRFYEIHQISCGFHEIRWISCEIERPLARNCNPMFYDL